MAVKDKLNLLPSQKYLGQMYTAKQFVAEAGNTDQMNRQLRSYVDSIILQYIVRPKNRFDTKNNELHFIMATTEYFKMRKTACENVCRSIQKMVPYPIILTICNRNKNFVVLLADSRKAKTGDFYVIENVYSTGWLSYSRVKELFDIIDQSLLEEVISEHSIYWYKDLIKDTIDTYAKVGFYRPLTPSGKLPFDEEVGDYLANMWIKFIVDTKDEGLLEDYWDIELSMDDVQELFELRDIDEIVNWIKDMPEPPTIHTLLAFWDDQVETYGADIIQDFSTYLQTSEYLDEELEKTKEESLEIINEILDSYKENEETRGEDFTILDNYLFGSDDEAADEDEW